MITRTNERIIGVLFLIATASYMIGSTLIEANLTSSDYLSHIYSNRTEIYIGLLLEFMNSAVVVGIAMLLFPLLRHHKESIAIGYLSSRIIESVLLIVGIISPLVLLTLSETFNTADGTNWESYSVIGELLIKGQEMTFELAMLALGIGSVMICYLMYRKKLIPRPLSLLGIVGYASLFASSCLSIIGVDPGIVLFIPGGIFEIGFPIWLIVKGFNK
ncbi:MULTISPECIES: DUF4386 domain-containing protein [Paenibacillus]|uniref:DUF4386 domain-containing protein n=1 Tax=Paenibacillus TaxID=44249 RepID=UPI00203A9055|nr:DUF4386 domain-containing protein [Paenibacillus camelliae]